MRGKVQSRNLCGASEVIWELNVRVRHALNIFRRLKFFRRHRSGLVSGYRLVVAILDLCKFNVRNFFMVHLCAVVIGDVARKLGEVGGHVSQLQIGMDYGSLKQLIIK